MLKKAIIVVSFGTSHSDACKAGIEPIEEAIREHFFDCKVVRAFISGHIREKIRNRDDIHIDSPAEAIERLLRYGYTDIVLQPTLVVPGVEYDRLVRLVTEYDKLTEDISVKLGKPLLHNDCDIHKIAESIVGYKQKYYPQTRMILVGHGTEHFANSVYFRLLNILRKLSEQIYLTLVESSPTFQDVLADIIAQNTEPVVLKPFMIVAGEHACSDMASDADGSLKALLQNAGIEAECVLKGIGGCSKVHEVFIGHIAELIDDAAYIG